MQEKHNEISKLQPLLTPSLIKGRIFRLDAMHTQGDFYRRICQGGGDDILTDKDNQPTLRENIVDLFEDPHPDRRLWQEGETWDMGDTNINRLSIVLI